MKENINMWNSNFNIVLLQYNIPIIWNYTFLHNFELSNQHFIFVSLIQISLYTYSKTLLIQKTW